MEDVAIDVISVEMVERAGHGLCDLLREARVGIVGQAMVLPGPISEFGLQKKIGAGDYAFAIGCGESFTDSRFEVMAALVGGVDGSKAGA